MNRKPSPLKVAWDEYRIGKCYVCLIGIWSESELYSTKDVLHDNNYIPKPGNTFWIETIFPPSWFDKWEMPNLAFLEMFSNHQQRPLSKKEKKIKKKAKRRQKRHKL